MFRLYFNAKFLNNCLVSLNILWTLSLANIYWATLNANEHIRMSVLFLREATCRVDMLDDFLADGGDL